MICPRNLLLCLSLSIASTVGALAEAFTESPVPGWAEVIEVDADSEIPEGSGAYYYIVADRQENLGETAVYHDIAVKLSSEEGVKEFAQLNFDFQAAYEKLEFHHIRIIRDGVVQERLEESQFEIIQREEGMEDQLFDGERTAYTILEDIRPGDILRYSYTKRGRNPVLPENQHAFSRLEFGVPVGTFRRRVLWEPTQFQLRWKIHGFQSAFGANMKETPGMIEWVSRNTSPPEVEEYTPREFFDYSWLEWSTFRDWEESGQWELQLYSSSESLPDDMVAVCEGIRADASSGDDEIVRALRWVQRNVRYLGSFLDEHTHAPHTLDQIVRRRFGDCKDKGMLLTAMLKYLGHDAAPALVNTSRRAAIKDYLPGHAAFNHLIVHVLHDGKDYFVDPTHTHQRGKLTELSLPAYGYAFIVRPGETALHKLEPRGLAVNKFRIEETYVAESLTGGATLEVVSTATGGEANSLRRTFADDPLDEISETYLEFYEHYWDGIEIVDPITFEDDEEGNRITIRERYRIPKFWATSNSGGEEFSSEVVAGYLKTSLNYPDQQERTHPYAISAGKQITQVIDVTFPQDWPVTEDTVQISHPAFSFDSKVTGRDDGFVAVFEYATLLREVPAKEFDSYRKKIGNVSSNLSLETTHNGNSTSASSEGSDFAYLLVGSSTAVGIILGGLFAVMMYFHDPKPRIAQPEAPRGLGGWMIIPVLATAISPLMNCYALSTYYEGLDEMGVLLRGESGFGVWRRYYASGAFLNGIILIPGFLLIALLTMQRTNFPLYYTVLLGADLLLVSILLIQELGIEGLDPPADPANWISGFIRFAIWGAYMIKSERVKATFTKRRGISTPPPVPIGGPPSLPA